jgi:hypothetical protein
MFRYQYYRGIPNTQRLCLQMGEFYFHLLHLSHVHIIVLILYLHLFLSLIVRGKYDIFNTSFPWRFSLIFLCDQTWRSISGAAKCPLRRQNICSF